VPSSFVGKLKNLIYVIIPDSYRLSPAGSANTIKSQSLDVSLINIRLYETLGVYVPF
jgi:hypothetical protein